jgi:hypothetical protein
VPKVTKRPGRPRKTESDESKELRDQVATLTATVEKLVSAQGKSSRELDVRVQQAPVPKAEPVPLPEPPPEPVPAVVFRSSSKNFMQRIIPGKKVEVNGEFQLIAPVYVEFAPLGSARVEDPEHVRLMRERKKDNDRRGLPTPWVEMSDEFADLVPVESVKHGEVGIDTSMDDAQMTPGFTPSELAGE